MGTQQRIRRACILSFWTMVFACQIGAMETRLTVVEKSSCVSPQCSCSVQRGIVKATCVIQDLTYLKHFIKKPWDVHALDLSSNRINDVPVGVFVNFTNLLNLSLANNRIQIFWPGAFRGLMNLLTLNISLNPLTLWQGHIYNDMTSLKQIDVTGNSQWIPDTNVMQLTTLTEIIGTSWSRHCSGCSLVKNVSFHTNDSQPRCTRVEDIVQGTCTDCLPVRCICVRHFFSNQSIRFARHGFAFAKCDNTKKCHESLSTKHLDDPCVRKYVIVLSVIQYPIGFIGIILNFITLFNILTTKTLRNNVSMLLASNMALCDISGCLGSVSIATVLVAIPLVEFLDDVRSICLPLGLLWFVGICGSITISFLLTTERYLTIVFSMRPEIRMRQKSAALCLLVTWILVLSLAIYSLVEEFSIDNNFCVPGTVTSENPKQLQFIAPISSIGMTLFIMNIYMYVHIYFVVRRSRRNMGIRRESKTARRIATLVVTNMVFFFVPTLVIGIFVVSNTYPIVQVDGKGETWKIAVLSYLPAICYNLNSCINPLLYAFRNDKFKERLRDIMGYLVLHLRTFRGKIGCCKSSKVEKSAKNVQETYDTRL